MRKLLIAIAIFGCSAEEAPPPDASGLAPLVVQGGTYLTHEAGNAGTSLTSPGGHALSPTHASAGQHLATISLSPCTSVALTTPHTGFAATAGVPIPLVATASCGDSTPEFMYWHKLAEDANWTQSGVYVASGDTFTPPTPGTWCVSVVTRALGSTASYEKRSAAVCGTVVADTGTPPPPPVQHFVVVAGGSFQFVGNTDPVTQVFVGRVDGIASGQTITAGSIAIQCAGTGGGYFIPCVTLRETGTFQCGPAVACGTSTSAPLPLTTPFVVGPTAHLDVALLGVAPILIPTTAVLTVQ